MRESLVSLLLLGALAPGAGAQAPVVVSPEIQADHRVSFRIYAPKASEVTLRGDWMTEPGSVKLEKDQAGVWSLTAGPLVPDLYSYSFNVDGVRTVDPNNPLIKPGINSVTSMFFLAGSEAAFEDNRLVPHGEIRQVWYQSSTLDTPRRMHVYTPPGYESSRTRYPVFYLLHGSGDDDAGWSTIGRAGFILDNLLADKKAKPMVVVMPNGSMPRPASAAAGEARVSAQERFTNELLKDVIPVVEKNFRVLTGRENRAIAGLSMGGGQTLRVITSNPDKFAYAGVWSSGVSPQAMGDFEKRSAGFLDNAEQTNKLLKVFSISVGDKDTGAYANARHLSELLNKRGVKHELHVSGGAHTWINWRRYLNEYAPLLFR